jgi:hypothetical protein
MLIERDRMYADMVSLGRVSAWVKVGSGGGRCRTK